MKTRRSPVASANPRRTEKPLPRLTSFTNTRTFARSPAAAVAAAAAPSLSPSITTSTSQS